MGGGGIFTTATVITSDMYSLRDRSLAQGISNIFNGVCGHSFPISQFQLTGFIRVGWYGSRGSFRRLYQRQVCERTHPQILLRMEIKLIFP